jgi:predicted Fe-S protein YdhL (DUF1289 family)
MGPAASTNVPSDDDMRVPRGKQRKPKTALVVVQYGTYVSKNGRNAMTIHADEMSLSTPCEAVWSSMAEVEGGRYCTGCERTVLDIGSMQESEVRALLASRGENRACVSFVVRRDGTVRTVPEAVIPPSRLLARLRPVALAASAMLLPGCGAVRDAMPYEAGYRIEGAYELFKESPTDFMKCVADDDCSPFELRMMGGV